MQTAGWSDVWHLGLAVFAHQSIELQIFIGLMAALCALMIVEGLRANFFPGRRAEAIKPASAPIIIEIEQSPPVHQAMPVAEAPPMRVFTPTRVQRAVTRKRSTVRARPQKAPRPTIRRAANAAFTGMAAE